METKSLLFGLIGFFLGGLIVSVAATNLNKPDIGPSSGMSLGQMTDSLRGKRGDDFDKAFITDMIEHHQGAIEMAKLAENNARHDEIKKLSQEIISAQEAEVAQMRQWHAAWGYSAVKVMPMEHRQY